MSEMIETNLSLPPNDPVLKTIYKLNNEGKIDTGLLRRFDSRFDSSKTEDVMTIETDTTDWDYSEVPGIKVLYQTEEIYFSMGSVITLAALLVDPAVIRVKESATILGQE